MKANTTQILAHDIAEVNFRAKKTTRDKEHFVIKETTLQRTKRILNMYIPHDRASKIEAKTEMQTVMELYCVISSIFPNNDLLQPAAPLLTQLLLQVMTGRKREMA